MKKQLIVLAWAFASTATAQLGDYLGPGVLSRGAGDVGQRSGQQVDLRYFVNLNGVYDTGIQPFAVDSKGNLVSIDGLYGMELQFGAYGTHRWRRAALGLDYRGSFYHYSNNSFYDGTDHNLVLGLTYQKSKRLSFDFQEIAGTTSRGTGGAGSLYGGGYNAVNTDVVNQPTTILFDNRTYYLQSTMDMSYMQSARTIYTVGGDGYTVKRASPLLAGVNGYTLRGSVRHRISKTTSVGVSYNHTHYDFPKAFGESTINSAEANFSTALGKRWTFNIAAGAFQAEVEGLQRFALDPVIAALLGQSTGIQAFYRKLTFPSGSVNFTGHLNKSSLVSVSYTRTVTPGNGVYLTSQQETAMGSLSYTGIRKWDMSVGGGYSSLGSIGQGLQKYSAITGGAGATYALTHAIHIVGRYDARHQEIDLAGYRHTGARATLGLGFSPGNVPLSLW